MGQPSVARAARNLAVPGLCLQALAVGIVAAYYFCAPCRLEMRRLITWHSEYGPGFSIVSTALFGGILPFFYLRARAGTRAANPISHIAFHLLFWGYKGFEVDWFYRLQAWLFGSQPGVSTVIRKVLLDQLVYTPFWAIPLIVIVYRWKEEGFGFAVFSRGDWGRYLRQNYPPAIISSWMVWIPAVAAVYSLPLELQIPLFNVELCFWTLLFTGLTQTDSRRPEKVG